MVLFVGAHWLLFCSCSFWRFVWWWWWWLFIIIIICEKEDDACTFQEKHNKTSK